MSLNTRGYYNSLGQMLEEAVRQGFLEEKGMELFRMVESPRTLVESLKEIENVME